MLMFKLFIACGVIAVGALSVQAADMELQLVDKNCWVEIFEDDNYDANDPHVKIQGPKEVSTDSAPTAMTPHTMNDLNISINTSY